MTPLELLSLLGILYSLLYIVDTFLRTNPSTSLRYLLKLRRLGLELSLFQVSTASDWSTRNFRASDWSIEDMKASDWSLLFQIKYSTTRYNSVLQRLAGLSPGLARAWFSLGAGVSVLLIPASMALLTFSLWQHLR